VLGHTGDVGSEVCPGVRIRTHGCGRQNFQGEQSQSHFYVERSCFHKFDDCFDAGRIATIDTGRRIGIVTPLLLLAARHLAFIVVALLRLGVLCCKP
jgi:hypothetical protein